MVEVVQDAGVKPGMLKAHKRRIEDPDPAPADGAAAAVLMPSACSRLRRISKSCEYGTSPPREATPAFSLLICIEPNWPWEETCIS